MKISEIPKSEIPALEKKYKRFRTRWIKEVLKKSKDGTFRLAGCREEFFKKHKLEQ